MKTFNYFKNKEARIKKAVARVDKILAEFKAGQRDSGKWNDAHDLKYRLEGRLFKNWSDYKDWHYNKFEFNIYTV